LSLRSVIVPARAVYAYGCQSIVTVCCVTASGVSPSETSGGGDAAVCGVVRGGAAEAGTSGAHKAKNNRKAASFLNGRVPS